MRPPPLLAILSVSWIYSCFVMCADPPKFRTDADGPVAKRRETRERPSIGPVSGRPVPAGRFLARHEQLHAPSGSPGAAFRFESTATTSGTGRLVDATMLPMDRSTITGHPPRCRNIPLGTRLDTACSISKNPRTTPRDRPQPARLPEFIFSRCFSFGTTSRITPARRSYGR